MLSPVDFISGPKFLFTFGNLLNEKTGCLIANPFNCGLNLKSVTLLSPTLLWLHNSHKARYSFAYKWNCSGSSRIGFNNINDIIFYGKLNVDQSDCSQSHGNLIGMVFDLFHHKITQIKRWQSGVMNHPNALRRARYVP